MTPARKAALAMFDIVSEMSTADIFTAITILNVEIVRSIGQAKTEEQRTLFIETMTDALRMQFEFAEAADRAVALAEVEMKGKVLQ